MRPGSAYWLWYPGDMELYHALKQNLSRVERGLPWPAFWKLDGFRHRVVFRRTYILSAATEFVVTAVHGALGYVDINGEKFAFQTPIRCESGEKRISIHIACIECMPAVYIEGDTVRSDEGWMVYDYDTKPEKAGYSRYFDDPARDPREWQYSEKIYEPAATKAVNGGTLYTFETELNASVEIIPMHARELPAVVYLGESRAEALDTENCYCFCSPDEHGRCPRRAVRYVFLPMTSPDDYRLYAVHQYLDIPVRARFNCDDEELNRIFETAAHTFKLCSDVFFLDGIKRDKWIWGGDAYQSMLVNRYLTADRDIERRTLIALRGNEPPTTHINTIVDYSLLWILSVGVYEESYRDIEFLRWISPKMHSLLEFCMNGRDELGFIRGRKQDWEFIDWADFDREGALCAEQMLLAACYGLILRLPEHERTLFYVNEQTKLLKNIEEYFWDEELGAYIDSFESGKRHVTRHANIFAILFGIADQKRSERILKTVLLNKDIPPITTPYFRFFELEALCRLGQLDTVLKEIKAYWGGMLRLGAVTFWEEYDADKALEQQYEMYGDPYGKSLCHAWASSPVYLLCRYYLGIQPSRRSSQGFEVKPQTRFFSALDCTVPYGGHEIHIRLKNGVLSVSHHEIT